MDRTRVRWLRSTIAVVATASCIGVLGARAGAGADRRPAARVYVVQAGDSLWSIATRFAGAGVDPRGAVDAVLRANHLDGAIIVPGQRLRIPARVSSP